MSKVVTKWEQQIIKLALQGKSNYTIADEMNLDAVVVASFIQSLSILNHPNYDLDTFQKIQIERNLSQRRIIDKDFLEDVVSLVFSGFTYVEIASMYEDKTEKDVQQTIYFLKDKHSIYKDEELYERVVRKNLENINNNEEKIFKRLEELEKNGLDLKTISASMLIKKYDFNKRLRLMIQEYLDHNMNLTDQYLATHYGFPDKTVAAIFTSFEYEQRVLKIITKETLERIREYRIANGLRLARESNQFPLEATEEEKKQANKIRSQMNLWIPILFTFKLSIEDLAIINNIKNFSLLRSIIYQSTNQIDVVTLNSLDYLFSHEIAADPLEALQRRNEAKAFLTELSKAQLTNNVSKYKEMLGWLMDVKAKKLIKTKKSLSSMTEEELNSIYEYRIKYAIPYSFFPYHRETLLSYMPEKYKDRMEEISDFNDRISKELFSKLNYQNSSLESDMSFRK